MRVGRETLLRWVYRLAYPLLAAYWFVARPRSRGVKCVLTRGADVLLVRHTYGPRGRWNLPGGFMRASESGVDAAAREMREELGVDGLRWRELASYPSTAHYRRDTIHCVQAELDARELRINRAELAEARWFARDGLPSPLDDDVRETLDLAA